MKEQLNNIKKRTETDLGKDDLKEDLIEKSKSESEDVINKFPIVGMGASAGGLESFKQFFSNMPIDSGMAFILVTHLDPNHKSILSELIKHFTGMRVDQVSDGIKIEPNCVYIIPPNFDMEISKGRLNLIKQSAPRGLRLPIDYFFRSLAEEQKEYSICVVLSGIGTDGTLGIREIKGVGGMAIVQDPNTAEFDGMPRSAINNSVVDYILPPDKMPETIIKHVQKEIKISVRDRSTPEIEINESLDEIFNLLKFQTRHDFSVYKKNTLLRRIERRMIINHFNQISDYVNYAKNHVNEIEILFKELLIGVTNFYRDKEAFKVLEENIIPGLFKNREQNQPLRIWIPGCSTGEEAYSIAILIHSYLAKTKQNYKVQIFATDIDNMAIEKARLGIYSDNIAIDVPSDLLNNYFTLEGGFYKVKKEIREKIIFAVQNIITDPPFSNVDLISCRNILIYLTQEVQSKLLILFYYSLNDAGFLFLGNSEYIKETPDLFTIIDRKWKIFQKKKVAPILFDSPQSFPPLNSRIKNLFKYDLYKKESEINYRNVMEKYLLDSYVPSCVIVNDKGNIIYIHGRTAKYLEPPEGEAKMNILKMVKDELKLKLTSALRIASSKKEKVHYKGLTIISNDKTFHFNLSVIPILKPNSMEGLFFVLFEEISIENTEMELEIPKEISNEKENIKQLEDELKSTKQYLQTTIEDLETANEELKSMNEELQSSNEELQSTNEELQTSKEELQSVNEEIITVNAELETKINELTEINDVMDNLNTSSEIRTIFLNPDLTIARFTPAVKEIFNLIESDIGRPISHISSNLNYDHLIDDVKEALKTLVLKDIDVKSKENKDYNMRILPYRTSKNIIEGAVITFFDITQRVIAENDRQEARDFAENIIDTIRESLIVLDEDLRVIKANKAFYNMFNVSSNEIEEKMFYELGNKQWDIPQLRNLLSQIVLDNNFFENYEIELNFERIGRRILLLNARKVIREEEKKSKILLMMDDITERINADQKLKTSEKMYKDAFNRAEFYKDLFTHDINNVLQIILGSKELCYRYVENPNMTEKIKDLLNTIENQINKARTLIKNVQTLSQIEKIEGSLHKIDIYAQIREIVSSIKDSFKNKNIKIQFEEVSENLFIFANKLINDVIENILFNSIKHNINEIIEIYIKLSREVKDDRNYVRIEFMDNGIGIEDNRKNMVFKQEYKGIKNGMGLGLTIVNKIINSYKGKIWVENRVKDDYSKGSNFILLIPEAT